MCFFGELALAKDAVSLEHSLGDSMALIISVISKSALLELAEWFVLSSLLAFSLALSSAFALSRFRGTLHLISV